MRGPEQRSVSLARRLRRDQTEAERVFWRRIRNRQLDGEKFVRQEPIAGYVCDFVCRQKLLIVELDGGQHGGPDDLVRDRRLEAEGFRILRFWNNDVLGNIDGVLEVGQAELAKLRPHLSPPAGRGRRA